MANFFKKELFAGGSWWKFKFACIFCINFCLFFLALLIFSDIKFTQLAI